MRRVAVSGKRKGFRKAAEPDEFVQSVCRRDEISRDAAPVREETAVTPSSAIRPTLSSGENPQDKERNVFGEGLRIDGDVSSDTDIVIRGTVHGNIVCRGDIELSGSVQGDIEGRNVRIVGGRIEGNVVCSEALKVERSSVVGNLTAQRAQIDNKVEGNITVHGTLALLREADIRGDIVARRAEYRGGRRAYGQGFGIPGRGFVRSGRPETAGNGSGCRSRSSDAGAGRCRGRPEIRFGLDFRRDRATEPRTGAVSAI